MTVTLAYPDAELVLMALLEAHHPEATVDTWVPEGDVETPFIHVMRIGGAPDAGDVTDYPVMRVACYGEIRKEAWDLSRAVEVTILSHRHRNIQTEGGPVLVDDAAIFVGGNLTPDLAPDDRRVVVDYILGWRRQRYAAPVA